MIRPQMAETKRRNTIFDARELGTMETRLLRSLQMKISQEFRDSASWKTGEIWDEKGSVNLRL